MTPLYDLEPMTVGQLITRLKRIKDKSLLIVDERSGQNLLRVDVEHAFAAEKGDKKKVWLITGEGTGG